MNHPIRYGITSASVLALLLGAPAVLGTPWSFGIMSDTQWPNSDDTRNPNVAVNVINHLNQQFIAHGVRFVIQVGDLTDTPGTGNFNLDLRAAFAQALYNAGIGFYPLRGNHESSASAALEFQRIFPQTGAVPANAGINNQTPADARKTTLYYGAAPIDTGAGFRVGTNFATESGLEGLSYSFDYDNARFVLIDQFTRPGGSAHSTLNQADLDWIGGRVAVSGRPAHAFVFAHKGLITENHQDNLFGASPDTATAPTSLTNQYMSQLYGNGVRYHIGGHDHMHNRAIVASPDGASRVQNIIAASDSYKFYIPPASLSGQTYRSLETQIAQELFTVGYYIVTVDGPRVTVDYYASPNGCGGDCDQRADVIPYTFTWRERFGYSLNGKEVVVGQGESLVLSDTTDLAIARGESGYVGSRMDILAGTNESDAKDFSQRPLVKAIDTGWAPRAAGTWSDILTLWGLQDSLATRITDNRDTAKPTYGYSYALRDDHTDTYVLSLSYDPGLVPAGALARGTAGLATRDAEGHWVNAVDANDGGQAVFRRGPWAPDDALGTYGVDAASHTAWAVIDHQGEFTVAPFAKGAPETYVLVARKAGPIGARVWTLKLVNGPTAVEDLRVDALNLTQTGGPACSPVLGRATPGTPAADTLTALPRTVGDLGPRQGGINSVQIDFTGCAATARFAATIHYSGANGLTGTRTLFNQFR